MGIFDMESDGSSDFVNIFSSEAERIRENEEKLRTEQLLNILDELEERQQPNLDLFDDRQKPRKEYMRVSITGDDEGDEDKERKLEGKKEDRKRVHTLDDLPPDDFGLIFGPPPDVPEPPTLKINTGRRLRDGKIQHMASFPGIFESLNLGDFFSIDLLLMLVFVVFLVGIYIGRRSNQRKMKNNRREKKVLQKQQQQPQIVYYQLPPGFNGSFDALHNSGTPITVNKPVCNKVSE
jgi:hypothetical protein